MGYARASSAEQAIRAQLPPRPQAEPLWAQSRETEKPPSSANPMLRALALTAQYRDKTPETRSQSEIPAIRFTRKNSQQTPFYKA